MKTKMIVIRITEDQEKIINERTRLAGFYKKSEYIRTILFKED